MKHDRDEYTKQKRNTVCDARSRKHGSKQNKRFVLNIQVKNQNWNRTPTHDSQYLRNQAHTPILNQQGKYQNQQDTGYSLECVDQEVVISSVVEIDSTIEEIVKTNEYNERYHKKKRCPFS